MTNNKKVKTDLTLLRKERYRLWCLMVSARNEYAKAQALAACGIGHASVGSAEGVFKAAEAAYVSAYALWYAALKRENDG